MGLLRFSASQPPATPAPALSPNRWWCPTSPQNDNAQRHRLPRGFSLELRHARRLLGQVTSDDALQVIRAQYGDQHRGPGPTLSPCVRSAGANFFHQWRQTADLSKRIDAGPPVATRWAAQRPAAPSPSRASGHWTRVDRLRKRAPGFTTIPTVRPISSWWYTSNLNGRPALTAPRKLDLPLRPAAAGGWFLVGKGLSRTIGRPQQPAARLSLLLQPAPSPGASRCHCATEPQEAARVIAA